MLLLHTLTMRGSRVASVVYRISSVIRRGFSVPKQSQSSRSVLVGRIFIFRENVIKVYVKVYKTLYFLNPVMDFVYIWGDYRCWSKIFLGTISTLAHDLQVKVTDRIFMLKFCVKVFKISYFLISCMDSLYICHEYRYWSKILFGTISTCAYDYRSRSWIKKFMLKFCIKVFKVS